MVKNPPAKAGDRRDSGSILGSARLSRAQQSTPVFLPGESNGQKSMEGCSQSGHKQSDTTEVTKHILTQGMARQG